jgi:hypothetical protein
MDDDNPQIRPLGPYGPEFFACSADGMFEVSHGRAYGRDHGYGPAANVGKLDSDISIEGNLERGTLLNTTDSLRSHFAPFCNRRRRRSSSHSIIVSSPISNLHVHTLPDPFLATIVVVTIHITMLFKLKRACVNSS